MAIGLAHRSNARSRRAFWLGCETGFVGSGITLYWVIGVMATYGGFAPWLAVPIAALLWAYLALYVGLVAWLGARAVRRFGIAGLWWVPVLWVAMEWVRSWFLSGFPWALLGSSQARVLPVAQFASVVGVYGLSALVALAGTAIAVVTLTRRRAHLRAVAGVAGLVVVVVVAGVFRLSDDRLVREGSPLRVGLVQGSIAQDAKWDPSYREAIMDRYISLSRQAIASGAALVIWPESSTPFFFNIESSLAEPLRRLAAQSHTPFLIGTDDVDRLATGPPRIYNAAVLVGPDGRSAGVYHKMFLVPFGEYVPLQHLLFFVAPLVQAVSDFSPGTEPTVFDIGGRRVSAAICYESVYPSLSRAFVEHGSELLAIITNDAWFGRSSAAYQHFDQGALRGVEEGRYVVRAANTGVSGVVDPYGRVLAETALFEPLTVMADVRLLDDRTIYSRIGDLVAWLSAAATVVLIFLVWRRPSGPLRV